MHTAHVANVWAPISLGVLALTGSGKIMCVHYRNC